MFYTGRYSLGEDHPADSAGRPLGAAVGAGSNGPMMGDVIANAADVNPLSATLVPAVEEQGIGSAPTVAAQPTRRRIEMVGPQRIGRFAVLDVLGEGGMGRVYAAYDASLDRRVALKVLRGEESPEQTLRIRREAHAMARLSHPNVCAVYDVGEHEGRTWIAMEYIDGETLAHWQRTPRPWRDVLAMYVRCGAGLAVAHDAGMLHRDFKPQNVLVGHDDRPRVIDFGLARAGDERLAVIEGPEPTTGHRGDLLDTPLTRAGRVAGTPAYMAPEQINAEPLDPRCDQFSFCVALYEALYGTSPFSLESLPGRLRSIADGPPSPPRSDVDPTVEQAILRGLDARPSERWPSMAALLEVLGGGPRAGRRVTLRAQALTFLICVGVVTAGALGLVFGPDAGAPDHVRTTIAHSLTFVTLLAAVAALRHRMLTTPTNRRLVSWMLATVAAPVVIRTIAWLDGAAATTTLALDLGAMLAVALFAAFAVVSWAGYMAVVFAIGVAAIINGLGDPITCYAFTAIGASFTTAFGTLYEARREGVSVGAELRSVTTRR